MDCIEWISYRNKFVQSRNAAVAFELVVGITFDNGATASPLQCYST